MERPSTATRRTLTAAAFAIAIATPLFHAARCAGPAPPRQRIVVLHAYSTLEDVLRDGLLPAFRERWRRERGETVEVVTSFAGSGELVERVLDRVPAQIAIVSSELDARRVPAPFLGWKELPDEGVLAHSPLVIVVRRGNPHGIRGFEDLARPGVALLSGDPATSGAASLALLAVHDAAQRSHGPDAGVPALRATWDNVVEVLPSSRDVRRRFESGVGDAFVTYEQAVVATPSREAVAGELVRPSGTLVAEPIAVRVGTSVAQREQEVVDALLAFLWSDEARRILVAHGFRDPSREPARRSDMEDLDAPRTLRDLGGWRDWRGVLDAWREVAALER